MTDGENIRSGWAELIKAIRSPLNVFALTVLVCNAVFALAAANLNSVEAFTYSMHLFLGIVGAFTLIALWSPGTLYHPDDIKALDSVIKFDEGKEYKRKIFITSTLVLVLAGYTAYELIFNRSSSSDDVNAMLKVALANIIQKGGNMNLDCKKSPEDNLTLQCKFLIHVSKKS